MGRSAVLVRDAAPDDVPALLTLWAELRVLSRDGSRGGRGPSPATVAGVGERLAACMAAEDARVLVAVDGSHVVGMAVLSLSRTGLLLEIPAVQLNHLVVADGHRRRGLGRALVAAGVAWAEELGAEEVVASVHPTLREGNRFYARLGFAPLVVRRAAPTAVLRRRLAQLERPAVVDPRRSRLPQANRRAGLIRRGRLAALDERAASLVDPG